MLLKDQLKKLDDSFKQEKEKVLSLYLNVDPRDPEYQGDKWKIKLKHLLKELTMVAESSESHEEKNELTTLKNKIENNINARANEFKRGFILFATANEDISLSMDVNIPVTSECHWDEHAQVTQLKQLGNKYPYTGILVLQRDKAQLIETELKETIHTEYYTLDLNEDNWRLHEGPQGDDWTKGGIKKDKFEDRVQANQERWLKKLAQTLQNKAKKQGWKQFYLVGEKQEIEQLKNQFTRDIDKVIPRNLLGRAPNEIIEEVIED